MPLLTLSKTVGHLIFWALVFYALYQLLGVQQIEDVMIINGATSKTITTVRAPFDVWLLWIVSVVMFYANAYYFLPKYFKSGNIANYVIAIAVGVGTVAFVAVLSVKWLRSYVNDAYLAGFPVYTGLVIVCSLFILSFAYFFILEWERNEKIKRELLEVNMKTELNFLRAQVQPHFLFNVLNNLMAMAVETRHKELVQGITSLSSLMRYMVYEGKEDKIALTSEVAYLDDYIQLQSLKVATTDRVKVRFVKEGDFASVSIAPFLLLPIVENAFKYGINVEEDSEIEIQLVVKEQTVNFKVTNTDHSAINSTNKEKSGIGLENLRRRLALMYPGGHSLTIDKQAGRFIISLMINTHHS